jgi:hypothetical protein
MRKNSRASPRRIHGRGRAKASCGVSIAGAATMGAATRGAKTQVPAGMASSESASSQARDSRKRFVRALLFTNYSKLGSTTFLK